MGSGKFCPKCEVDKVKTELKLLPTKFLLCEKCKATFRLVDSQLFQVALKEFDANQMNEKPAYKNYKFLNLLIAGFLATLVFNGVMYMDIAVTGIPLHIPTTLGQLAVGESENAEMVGHGIHILNGMGLALLFGYVALPISKRIVRLPIWLYAVIFMIIELIVTVWFGMLPALGAGIAGLNIAPEVPVVTLVRHVAFGLTLGLMIKSS